MTRRKHSAATLLSLFHPNGPKIPAELCLAFLHNPWSQDRAGREQRATLSAELKSAGNDAFGTEDWGRALQCYARSVSLADPCCKLSAKTYSNLAATLCKLSLFDDAKACAKRSTQIDPA